MMLSMTKMARTTRTILVMRLLAGSVGCTVVGTVVGDAEKRIRVKPLSRPQTRQMPPAPLTQYPYCADSLYPSHGGPYDRSPGQTGGREEPSPHGALTANGGARFPATQSCCDIRDGDMRMQSSGATAEAVLTDFLK